jgi:RNA polymerase sigma factor (sigma-70 family)
MNKDRQAALIASKYHDSLYRWALALSHRDRQEALGIVQQTYLEVLEGRAKLLLAKDPRAFLFGVARKIAASRRRRRSTLARILGVNQPPDAIPVPIIGPADAAAEKEAVLRVRQALTELPSRQLEVTTLVFMEGLTVEEAALALGVSVGTARTHYHRAKKRLSALLKEENNA